MNALFAQTRPPFKPHRGRGQARRVLSLGLAMLSGAAHACDFTRPPVELGTIVDVRDRYELLLEDGRVLLPAGLAILQPTGPGPKWSATARQTLRSWIVGSIALAVPEACSRIVGAGSRGALW